MLKPLAYNGESKFLIPIDNYTAVVIDTESKNLVSEPLHIFKALDMCKWNLKSTINEDKEAQILTLLVDLVQEKSKYRDALGRFTIEQKNIPTKKYRNFLRTLRERYGNMSLDDLILGFASMTGEIEPIPRTVQQALLLDKKSELDQVYFIANMPEENKRTLERFSILAQESLVDVDGIEYEDPYDYHLTLVLTKPGTSPKAIASMAVLMEEMLSDMYPYGLPSITFDGYGTFNENVDGISNVLYLKVMPSDELMHLQSMIYKLVNGHIVEPSDFSDPETWTPHITLAYSIDPINEKLLPDIGGMTVPMSSVMASVDYNTLVEYKA